MIIRSQVSANFTNVPNALLRDERLSADALGLLVFLLHHPRDWIVRQAHLAARFDMGREKVQRLMRELIDLGYVRRSLNRNPGTQQFERYEYQVFDTVQGTGEPANGNEPQPENQATAPICENKGISTVPAPNPAPIPFRRRRPQPEKPWPENQAAYKEQIIQNPSSKGLSPREEGFKEDEQREAPPSSSPPAQPSLTAQVWTAAKAILKPSEHGCVPKWLERVKDRPGGLDGLLAIINSARNTGTALPVPYITAALNRQFPPPPDPRTFTRERWKVVVQAAVNVYRATRAPAWEPHNYGPAPGEPGCLVPPDLVTKDLIRAASMRRAA